MKRKANRWILAIDPGTQFLGYCLGRRGDRVDSVLVEMLGTLVIPRGTITSRLGYIRERLFPIFERADELDAEVVVERPFVGGHYTATVAIARVNGSILGEIGVRRLRFFEYLPNQWKRVAGSGSASIEQVAQFVRAFLGLRNTPEPDAAAAACMLIYHATRN